jgi:hypothetical protein
VRGLYVRRLMFVVMFVVRQEQQEITQSRDVRYYVIWLFLGVIARPIRGSALPGQTTPELLRSFLATQLNIKSLSYLKITIMLTPSAPSLQTALFCRKTNFPYHSTTDEFILLFNTVEVSYLSLQVLLRCWEIIFSFVLAVARRFA